MKWCQRIRYITIFNIWDFCLRGNFLNFQAWNSLKSCFRGLKELRGIVPLQQVSPKHLEAEQLIVMERNFTFFCTNLMLRCRQLTTPYMLVFLISDAILSEWQSPAFRYWTFLFHRIKFLFRSDIIHFEKPLFTLGETLLTLIFPSFLRRGLMLGFYIFWHI